MHLMVGEEGHEVEQARQLQVPLAGLLVAALPLALLALPLQQTAQAQGWQENCSVRDVAYQDTCDTCRRHSHSCRTKASC